MKKSPAEMVLELPSHEGRKSTGRIRRKNEELIVNAAKEEFALKGYDGATIDSIAKRAGLPRPNIHYYFDSKLALYGDILSGIVDLWDDALNDLEPTDEPAAALTEYIQRKLMFSRRYPLDSRIFAKEILSGAPRLETYFERGYRPWFERKVKVFQEWAEQGKMDSIDPAHLMFLIWSSTQHYADFEAQIGAALGVKSLGDWEFDAAAQTLVSVILKGVGIHPTD
ncbi:TetR family transcriptional regulator [Halioglobus japonicus]|nr:MULTISPECIES: TetR/AcrR family transcriptional regulator [Halioglobus]GHD16863.1 TetR family transcriptional regulator [Halioglobus japonicus]